MDEETTRHLENALREIDSEDEGTDFLREHSGVKYAGISDYFNAYLGEKGLSVSDVIDRSNIDSNYAYGILNGNKRHPGRDYVLCMCIAMRMSYSETNRALKIAGHSAIYPKDERDVRIAIEINRGTNNVTDVNLILDNYSLKPLK